MFENMKLYSSSRNLQSYKKAKRLYLKRPSKDVVEVAGGIQLGFDLENS
jgi:hypothetical protein